MRCSTTVSSSGDVGADKAIRDGDPGRTRPRADRQVADDPRPTHPSRRAGAAAGNLGPSRIARSVVADRPSTTRIAALRLARCSRSGCAFRRQGSGGTRLRGFRQVPRPLAFRRERTHRSHQACPSPGRSGAGIRRRSPPRKGSTSQGTGRSQHCRPPPRRSGRVPHVRLPGGVPKRSSATRRAAV